MPTCLHLSIFCLLNLVTSLKNRVEKSRNTQIMNYLKVVWSLPLLHFKSYFLCKLLNSFFSTTPQSKSIEFILLCNWFNKYLFISKDSVTGTRPIFANGKSHYFSELCSKDSKLQKHAEGFQILFTLCAPGSKVSRIPHESACSEYSVTTTTTTTKAQPTNTPTLPPPTTTPPRTIVV